MNALNNRPRRAGTFFLWLALCGAGASCSSSGSSPSSGEDRTGAEGEACFANGTCFDGLACLSNRCVVLPGSSSSSGTSSGTSSGGMTGSTSGGSSSSSGGLLTSSSGGSSSGLGITSSSSSGGMAGSSSSSGGMPGGSAATLFLQDVHETLCARLGACGSGDDQPADCARRSASVLEGWAQLDDVTVTTSAASCLAGLAALSCAEVLRWDRVSPSNLEMRFLSHPQLSACQSALAGTRTTGQSCSFFLECQPGMSCQRAAPYCATDGAWPEPTCQPRSTAGGPCFFNWDCAAGLECHEGTCTTARAPGDACNPDSFSECGPDGWCAEDARCRRWVREGAACDGTTLNTCDPPLACTGGTCTFAVAAGARCQLDTQCPQDQSCLYAECTARRAEGASCDSPLDCASGSCDPVERQCRGTLSAGQACTSTSACAVGLFCPSGTCVSPGGAGAPCTQDRHCLPGSWCPGNGALASCQPLGDYGAPCAYQFLGNSRGCQDGFHCEGVDSQGRMLLACQVLGTTGAACLSDGACVDGLQCVAGMCQPLGAVSTACNPQGGAPRCAKDLVCSTSGVCQPRHQQADGTPCNNADQCRSHYCDLANGTCDTFCFP